MSDKITFPHEGLARLPKVTEFLGVGKSTLWGWVKNDKFPQPVRIGRVTAWRATEVRRFVEEGGNHASR